MVVETLKFSIPKLHALLFDMHHQNRTQISEPRYDYVYTLRIEAVPEWISLRMCLHVLEARYEKYMEAIQDGDRLVLTQNVRN